MSKRILILTTGGTIASAVNPETGGVTPLKSGEELLNAVPEIGKAADVKVESALQKPSWDFTRDDVFRIIQRLLLARKEGWNGVVVTHGTDTMEETSFLSQLVLGDTLNVCFTGAMRHSMEVGTDGPRNLLDAVRVAASPQMTGKGTVLVMDGEIHDPRWVRKTHATRTHTFASPYFGPLGYLSGQRLYWSKTPVLQPPLPLRHLDSRVPVLTTPLGMDAEWLSRWLQQPIDGLVIEATGAGNMPSSIAQIALPLVQQGTPVVVTSRVLEGWVEPIYEGVGGHKFLAENGFISGGMLTAGKARLLLMALLSDEADSERIREQFGKHSI